MRENLVLRIAAIAAVTAAMVVLAPTRANAQPSGSITVIYNHEGSGAENDLVKRGGFAAYARLEDRAVIFDAGGEASVVLENLASLGLIDTEVAALVISHNHWDHVYGLPGVMRSASNPPPVYAVASAAAGIKQQFPRAEVIGVDGPKQIAPEVWLTGPMDVEFMDAPLSEQAMVLDLPKGLHIIVGCSHPGIVVIVERVREMFPDKTISLVAGGFHLRSTGEEEIRRIASDLERLGVQKIAPSHCTGALAEQILRERWGQNFLDFKLGDRIEF